jgi:hypothetical protein
VSAGLRRYHDHRRKVAKVAPRDLRRLEQSGTVALALKPLLPLAAEEAYELTEALGGLNAVSPQRRVLIEDLVAIGLALRATLALFLQSSDPELASKVGTLAAARRASLQALGLERVAKELDLNAHLAKYEREDRAQDASDSDPDSSIESTSDVANCGNGEGAAPTHPQDGALHPDSSPARASSPAPVGHEGGAERSPPPAASGAALTSGSDPEDDPC